MPPSEMGKLWVEQFQVGGGWQGVKIRNWGLQMLSLRCLLVIQREAGRQRDEWVWISQEGKVKGAGLGTHIHKPLAQGYSARNQKGSEDRQKRVQGLSPGAPNI